jgi:hypothetical protein
MSFAVAGVVRRCRSLPAVVECYEPELQSHLPEKRARIVVSPFIPTSSAIIQERVVRRIAEEQPWLLGSVSVVSVAPDAALATAEP